MRIIAVEEAKSDSGEETNCKAGEVSNDEMRELVSLEESRALKRDVFWAAIFDLQLRVYRYLIRVMLQRKEDILPQHYQRTSAIITLSSLVSLTSQPARPGTVRPVYLTPPSAALELLMSCRQFHPLPTTAAGMDIITDWQWLLEKTDALCNTSPHHSEFANVLGFTHGSGHGCHLWSLYMGPVYVYENDYTAGKGIDVDTSELSRLATQQPQRDDGEQRAVRVMYIDA